jgi:hypothetical protein
MINNRSFNVQDVLVLLLITFFSGCILFFLSIPYMEANVVIDFVGIQRPYNEGSFTVSPMQLCMSYFDSKTKNKINSCKDTSQITDEKDNNYLDIKKYSETLFGLYIAISCLTIIFLLTYLYGNKKIYKSVAVLLLLVIIATFATLITFINITYIQALDTKYYFEFTSGSIITLVMFGIMLLLLSYILYK